MRLSGGQSYPSDRFLPSQFSKAMPKDHPRCPYCVDGDRFRLLTPLGDLFRCGNCGHLAKPPLWPVCHCHNCNKIKELKINGYRRSFKPANSSIFTQAYNARLYEKN